MDRVRVRNLRSLADTGEIVLKPITLLVGANSSGKSSFLRFFPLLKQSTETRTRSGLLLNEPYVDYGLFPIAVRKGADPPEITFDLGTSFSPGSNDTMFGFILNRMQVNLSISFAQRSRENLYSYVHRLTITIDSPGATDIVSLEAKEDGEVSSLLINEYKAQSEARRLHIRAGRGVVPVLADASDQEGDGTFVSEKSSRIAAFTDGLLNATGSIFHGRVLVENKLKIFRAIKLGSPNAMLSQMRQVTDIGSWNQGLARWDTQSLAFRKFRDLIIGDRLDDMLNALGYAISDFATGVSYFEPVRARVQRDYRSRDVQIESVDPDGGNLAMFLRGFRLSDQNAFREWSAKNFGFSVHPVAVGDGARVALRLTETSSGAEFNLADVGFGYSQMLPLLVQIWRLTEEPERSRLRRARFYRYGLPASGYLVAIEQPELHLHPAMQAKIADLLINTLNVLKEKKVPIRFVVETHSQTIVNRLGHLVEAQKIAAEDVQLLLFERGSPGKDPTISELTKATFSTDGVLQNWPFGFFLPELDQLDVIEPLTSEASND